MGRRQRGQNLVELALLLPLLVAITALVLDAGRGLQAYMVLINASREAVRYASSNPTDTAGITDIALAEIQRGGLSTANASVSVSGSTPGSPVQVTVTYQMPLVFNVLGTSQLTIQASSEAVVY
ncbi:MAG: hypothetical protein GXP39_05335 [Chloroflexi bacterium]|nr:hypothetical protein [Chloroflexota bacterium]